MNANQIKNHLLAYWRFNRGWLYCATEVWHEDVVVSDGRTLIFVEVKISYSDYKAEFKKVKHTNPYRQRYQPNRKYFAAPLDLALRIRDDIKERDDSFGVLAIDDTNHEIWQGSRDDAITIIHKAKAIHDDKISHGGLNDILARMGSELITVRTKVRT